MNEKELIQFLELVACRLGEQFANVQILVSWPSDEGGTSSLFRGSGDWYARQGLAHRFIHSDQADEAAKAIAEKLNSDT